MNTDNDWLVLVPTQTEADLLQLHSDVSVEICGFGPIAAAATTAALIAQHRPQRILLIGIAGGYADKLAVGESCQFAAVQCVGVGVGTGDKHVSAGQAGWLQFPPTEIGDCLSLATVRDDVAADDGIGAQLLTVCTAAADAIEAEARRKMYPDAVAEDMEGFGVAVAAQQAGLDLHIVRGISNVAGDRDHQSWQIGEALKSASDLANSIIRS